ncbi:sodium:solute symporter family protein [Natronospora cellulosivora (SeqCode)]
MNRIIITVVYLAILAFLGFLGFKHTKNSKDYLIGGRQIHPVIMAFSYGAAFISTSAIVGFGGAAGVFGLGLLWLTFLTIFVGVFIAFVLLGKRTRKMGHNLNAHTFPELISRRFQSVFIQKFAGSLIFLFMPLYAAAVMIGASMFLEASLNIDYNAALFSFSILIAIYVFYGGLKGVMYSDAFQGSLMLVGMSILLIWVYRNLGGISNAHIRLTEMMSNPLVLEQLADEAANILPGFTGWTSMPEFLSINWWYLVSSVILGVGIGVLAQPQLVVRFMTVKSNRELNRAVPVGGFFILMMTGVAFIVGALSNVYFFDKYGQISVLVAGDSGGIIPLYINHFMPEWFSSFFLVVIVAAGMSTISSQFHAMGTALSRDLFNLEGKSEEQKLLLSRVGMLISIIITIILAYILPQIWSGAIAASTALFFGICGASFIPMYVGGLYFKKMPKEAAEWGMVAGFITSLFWIVFVHITESASLRIADAIFSRPSLAYGSIWAWVDPIVIALSISILVTILLSFLKKSNLKEEHLDICFKGIDMK